MRSLEEIIVFDRGGEGGEKDKGKKDGIGTHESCVFHFGSIVLGRLKTSLTHASNKIYNIQK